MFSTESKNRLAIILDASDSRYSVHVTRIVILNSFLRLELREQIRQRANVNWERYIYIYICILHKVEKIYSRLLAN